MSQTYQASFCAICCSDDGPLHYEPLGKDDALVAVCESCATDTPIAYDSNRCYEEQPAMSQAEMNARIAKLGEGTAYRTDWQFQIPRSLTPGWILVKTPVRGANGKPRDSHEACRALAHLSWARQLRVLGTSHDHTGEIWHLFERPDPKVAERNRTRSENPIAWLSQYRTEPNE